MSPEMKRGPVSPAEAAGLQIEQIPNEVFETFNGLIAQNLHDGRAIVRQYQVVGLLEAKGFVRSEVYARHWLDVEDSYRAVGWQVKYDKPGYNETYEPYFEFICRKDK